MSEIYEEPARSVPVLGHWDVVVCGGGAAGCAAAIAAARLGAKTLLIEKDGYLGGATVSQLVSHVLSTNGVDFQGVWHEWIRALRARGGVCALTGSPPHYRSGVDPEKVKYAWDDLLTAAGACQLLHTCCSCAIVEDGVCRGLLVETKGGRRAVFAKRVIDCTADGAVCASAGVPWEQGDGSHPWGQSLTKVFRMGNVRWPECDYAPEATESARKAVASAIAHGEYDTPVLANGRGINYGMAPHVHRSVMPYRTEMNVFASRVLRINPLDPWDLTRAEREGREQAWQCADALKRFAPGFEQAYMLDTNAHIGLRDSRRIRGIATAKGEDVMQFRKHPDGIARSSWDIDIWPADSYSAPAVDRESPEYQMRKAKMLGGDYFDIRYGCLVAYGVDNLLVAGRCLSAECMAQASLRIQQTCQSTGQAAGVAAALSLRTDQTPRELDPQAVVAQLNTDRDVEPAFDSLKTLPASMGRV
ncbi:MAG: FAD-dependent oxidoreductase [Victivallales bacterium]|jgi:hypothetical protein